LGRISFELVLHILCIIRFLAIWLIKTTSNTDFKTNTNCAFVLTIQTTST